MIPIQRDTFTRRFSALASALTAGELDALLQMMEVLEVPAGGVLIAEDTASDALYFVWDGELDVVMKTPQGEREIARVGPGSLLGEVSLLDPGPATATVRADQGATALVLARAKLDGMWDLHPGAAAAFLREMTRALSVRIRGAAARLDALAKTGAGEAAGVHGMLYQGGRA